MGKKQNVLFVLVSGVIAGAIYMYIIKGCLAFFVRFKCIFAQQLR